MANERSTDQFVRDIAAGHRFRAAAGTEHE